MLFTNENDERTRIVDNMMRHATKGVMVTIHCQDCIHTKPFDIPLDDFVERFRRGIFTIKETAQ